MPRKRTNDDDDSDYSPPSQRTPSSSAEKQRRYRERNQDSVRQKDVQRHRASRRIQSRDGSTVNASCSSIPSQSITSRTSRRRSASSNVGNAADVQSPPVHTSYSTIPSRSPSPSTSSQRSHRRRTNDLLNSPVPSTSYATIPSHSPIDAEQNGDSEEGLVQEDMEEVDTDIVNASIVSCADKQRGSREREHANQRMKEYRKKNKEVIRKKRQDKAERERAAMVETHELSEPEDIPPIAGSIVLSHSLGKRNNVCPYCKARHFSGTRICCDNGLVYVPPYRKMPEPLRNLLFGYGETLSNHFHKHILQYNALYQFASIQYDRGAVPDYCPPIAKVNGLIRHFPSSVVSNNPSKHRFGNLYILDSDDALKERLNHPFMEVLKPEVVADLQRIMEKHPFARMYKSFFERMEEDRQQGNLPEFLRVKIVSPFEPRSANLQGHEGVYVQESATPQRDYVLIFFNSTVSREILPPGLIIYPKLRKSTPRPIHYWRPEIDTLTYPLLFPFGELGFDRRAFPLQTPRPFEEKIEKFLNDNPDFEMDSESTSSSDSTEDAADPDSIASNSVHLESPSELTNDITSEGTTTISDILSSSSSDNEDLYDMELTNQINNRGESAAFSRVRFIERHGQRYPVRDADEDPVRLDHRDDEDDSGDDLNIDMNQSQISLLESEDPYGSDHGDIIDDNEVRDDRPITIEGMPASTDTEVQDDEDDPNASLGSDISDAESNSGVKRKKKRTMVSDRQHARYVLQDRKLYKNRIRGGGKLGQVYLIDRYLRIMQSQMKFIQEHYTEYCTSTKKRVLKAFERLGEKRGVRIGAVTTLPSKFPGSPRYLRKRYENAVAIANKLGKPDIFITFTANSDWEEIRNELKDGENWTNRQALVNEVFAKKREALLDDVVGVPKRKGSRKGPRQPGIFGPVAWFTYSVEFQRSGLPHMHLLLALRNKIKTTQQIDKICKATLPRITIDDPNSKKLRELADKFMIHTPCEGNPASYCNEGRKPHWKTCRKRFPKQFRDATEMGDRNYPELARPDDGETCQKQRTEMVNGRKTKVTVTADNRHVVPYNPFLLSKYGAHCNVEVVSSILFSKYLFKYLFKGFDRALVECFDNIDNGGAHLEAEMTVSSHILHPKRLRIPASVVKLRNQQAVDMLAKKGIPTTDANKNPVLVFNECDTVMDMGATTSMEAAYHLEGYPRTGCSHEVVTTFVHAPDEEPMKIDFDKELEAVNKAANDEVNSQLKAWFKLNAEDGEIGDIARKLTFEEIPLHFSYNSREGKWKFRTRTRKHFTISKIKHVNPRFMTAFAIRLLCQNQRGPRSFEELRTVNNVCYDTFEEAARAMRLMNSEDEWDLALKEASHQQMPAALRRMFVTILLYCAPKNPRKLFENNKEIFYQRRTWSDERNLAHALYHIESGLRAHGVNLEAFHLPEINIGDLPPPDELHDDDFRQDYSVQLASKIGEEMKAQLTPDQKKVVDQVMESIDSGDMKSFFLEAPGGCGKTFVYKTLYYLLRGKGKNVLCVAHTGIAASLLPHGMTVHRAFGIPIEVEENMSSRIALDSTDGRSSAELLHSVDVVLWDEACMTDRRIYEAIDKLLQIVHEDRMTQKMFGGVTFLLGGDWRQTLPIVEEVSGEATVAYTLKRSKFWKELVQLKLTDNLRAKDDPEFANWVRAIGDGRNFTANMEHVSIPEKILLNSEKELIQHVFGNGKLEDREYVKDACILTVDNNTSLELNERIIKMKDGDITCYRSRDEHDPDHGFLSLLPEIYNGITPKGMPPHKLNLKKGSVVILQQNLSVNLGLVNGLRMRVVKLGIDTIHCEPLYNNDRVPNEILLHRIAMSPAVVNCKDFAFIRWQFPIRLAYSMTINKAQGQTLGTVGVLFRTPPFSHGQLYVALSRVRSFAHIRIVNFTNVRTLLRNVVYYSILDKNGYDARQTIPHVATVLNSLEPTHTEATHTTSPSTLIASERSSRTSGIRTRKENVSIICRSDPTVRVDYEPDDDEEVTPLRNTQVRKSVRGRRRLGSSTASENPARSNEQPISDLGREVSVDSPQSPFTRQKSVRKSVRVVRPVQDSTSSSSRTQDNAFNRSGSLRKSGKRRTTAVVGSTSGSSVKAARVDHDSSEHPGNINSSGTLLLENSGNNFCFANSIVQALRTLRIKDDISRMNNWPSMSSLMDASGQKSVATMLEGCSHQGELFDDRRQHCAHDFLDYIMMEKMPLIISRRFSINFRQQFRCVNCGLSTLGGQQSVFMLTLTVETLGECLTFDELIDTNRIVLFAKKKCSGCGNNDEDNHTVKNVYELPAYTTTIAVICPRFMFSVQHQQQVPSQLEIVQPPSDVQQMLGCSWELKSAVCRYGTLQRGHFKTYVRTRNGWTIFDDERSYSAQEMDWDAVNIIFFERRL